jgi:hypothetical protein
VEAYRLVLASSNGEREGMALELQTARGERIADVFEDDETGRRSVRFYAHSDVPLEAVRWLLSEAESRL